jgi:5-methylcytosine-specific restriction endonuclease McrA
VARVRIRLAAGYSCEFVGRLIRANCHLCEVAFHYTSGRLRLFCSAKCRNLSYRKQRTSSNCLRCRVAYFPSRKRNAGFCSRVCANANSGDARRIYPTSNIGQRAHGAAYRARKKGAVVEKFDPVEVFERDGWRCGICRGRINKHLQFPDKLSASIDHIVPISNGGDHSRRNTQASHWLCNSRKSSYGTGDQLRLFG